MSVQPVQLHSPDQVATQGRRQPTVSDSTPSPSERGRFTPQDAVVVSEQARQLAAGARQESPKLQLDFRQLRELAFRAPAPSPRASDSRPADSSGASSPVQDDRQS